MIKEIKPLRVLVVEDNPGDLILLKKLLKYTKIPIQEIYTAEQLFKAEAIIKQHEIDLAFLDLTLPDSTGINSFINLNKLLPNIPIIVLSGLTDMQLALEAISQGAQDYVIKGEFDHKLLAKSIQYSIERKKTISLEKELSSQQINQQRLITELTIQAQEKERDQLGKELHDNINQVLATIKMYLGMSLNKQDNQADNLLLKSLEYTDYAMEEIRKLSKTLVAPSLGKAGLIASLEKLTAELNASNQMEIVFINEGVNEKYIKNDVQLMLYRVCQEQLNNIYKYAQANTTTIVLKADVENTYLAISDNGIGFDTSKKSHGIGLQNISSRVTYYSGSVSLDSSPGHGCTLKLKIPLQKIEVTNVEWEQ